MTGACTLTVKQVLRGETICPIDGSSTEIFLMMQPHGECFWSGDGFVAVSQWVRLPQERFLLVLHSNREALNAPFCAWGMGQTDGRTARQIAALSGRHKMGDAIFLPV